MSYLFMHLIQRLIPNGGCCGVIMTLAAIFAMTLLFCAVPLSEERAEAKIYNGSGVVSTKKNFQIDFPAIAPGRYARQFVKSNEGECVAFKYPSHVEISVLRADSETIKILVYNPGKYTVNLNPIYFTIKKCNQ